MKIINGELWDELDKAHILLITTNSTLDKNGCLVMGRGAALEAKERFPELPFRFGKRLREVQKVGSDYGIITVPLWDGLRIGAFQVKYHWRDAADLELIGNSTESLAKFAHRNPDTRIAMNMPGTGNGRLDEDSVIPIISTLPDNVFVYRKAEAVIYVDELHEYPDAKHSCLRAGACHMTSDDIDALHAFAAKIGLKRDWFQNRSRLPHYDLTIAKRELAVKNGAVEIFGRERMRQIMAREKEVQVANT